MLVIALRLTTALLFIGVPILLAWYIRRRYHVSLNLMAVGVLTFIGAFLAQFVLLLLSPQALLQSPLVGAMITGLIFGLTDAAARFLGFHQIAQSTVYRPQAAMIGLGHALLPLAFAGFWALWLGLGLTRQELTPFDLEAFGSALAEISIYLFPLAFSLWMSWLVLQTFLRNEIGWVFQAVFWNALVYGTATFIVNGSTDPAGIHAIWWLLAGVGSLIAFWRLKPPEEFTWQEAG